MTSTGTNLRWRPGRAALAGAGVVMAVLAVTTGCASERGSLVPADQRDTTTGPSDDRPSGPRTCADEPATSIGPQAAVTLADGTTVTTYRVAPERWRIALATADGASIDDELLVDLGSSPDTIRPLGAHDIDSNGSPELFTVVGGDDATALVAVHTTVDCALMTLTVAGSPLSFPVGGDASSVFGVECADLDADGTGDGLVARIGLVDPGDEGVVSIDEVSYRLDGVDLVEVDARSVATTPQAAEARRGLRCGELRP